MDFERRHPRPTTRRPAAERRSGTPAERPVGCNRGGPVRGGERFVRELGARLRVGLDVARDRTAVCGSRQRHDHVHQCAAVGCRDLRAIDRRRADRADANCVRRHCTGDHAVGVQRPRHACQSCVVAHLGELNHGRRLPCPVHPGGWPKHAGRRCAVSVRWRGHVQRAGHRSGDLCHRAWTGEAGAAVAGALGYGWRGRHLDHRRNHLLRHDQTGAEVSAVGRISVNFADWGD